MGGILPNDRGGGSGNGSYLVRFNAHHITVRGEPVEPAATQPEPFDKLRANGFSHRATPAS